MKFSITELNNMISIGIESAFPHNINLSGEISNLKKSRGHIYCNLKDSDSVIKAIIWKSNLEKMDLNLKEGNKIESIGHLNYYNPSGTISFIIDKIEIKKDIGKIKQRYDELKLEFKDKGYFDVEKKKKLLKSITKVSIITASEGAALQDIMYVFKRQEVNFDIKVINATVQGKNCPKEVSKAIKDVELDSDLLLITRGGGDMEDLFGFSDPLVIEAIHKCPIFTISAIGHEIDFMLSDFVADHRAPTPSIAAEYICLHNKKIIDNIELIEQKILKLIKEKLNQYKLKLLTCKNNLENPLERIKSMEENLKFLIKSKIDSSQLNLEFWKSQIRSIKPQKDNIILSFKGKKIDSLRKFKKYINDKLKLSFYDGEIEILINNRYNLKE